MPRTKVLRFKADKFLWQKFEETCPTSESFPLAGGGNSTDRRFSLDKIALLFRSGLQLSGLQHQPSKEDVLNSYFLSSTGVVVNIELKFNPKI